MASSLPDTVSVTTKAFMLALLPVAAIVGASAFWPAPSSGVPTESGEIALALLLPQKQREIPWVVIEAPKVSSGTTVPPDTNVIFHVPVNLAGATAINREVLLGARGSDVRYWGYCLPQNDEPAVVESRQGFPGLMFLSDKERQAQRQAASSSVARRSIYDIKAVDDSFNEQERERQTGIRHQIDNFPAGSLCFIMTEAPLPIGLDVDGDLLNGKAEQGLGTDPLNPDSDGDGVPDGLEVRGGTQAAIRDTDSDGLIDGIEDKNLDGELDPGETDPRNRDSDRDGLCDGLCVVRVGNDQILELGEDKNLNGRLDTGETDPLLRISNTKVGVNDYDAVYRCLFGDTSVCP